MKGQDATVPFQLLLFLRWCRTNWLDSEEEREGYHRSGVPRLDSVGGGSAWTRVN